MRRDPDSPALLLLVASTVAALLVVPDLTLDLVAHPALWAVIAAAMVFGVLVVLRAQKKRGTRAERRILALFLGFMPTVYLVSWMLFGDSVLWLLTELAGQAAFVGLAFLGARRWPWAVGLGIAAHGILWDSWHYGVTPFIPDWYVVACLLVDLGWGAYALAQVRAWRAKAA